MTNFEIILININIMFLIISVINPIIGIIPLILNNKKK